MAAKLILSMDGVVLKEYTLGKERMTIGRKAHNDIAIDNLAVSGEHAAIVTILNDSFLEDLDSTNGTVVNGTQVKKHFLQNNDVIEIGKYKLKYINEQPTQTTAADFEKTMVLRAPAAGAAASVKKPDDGAFMKTQVNMTAQSEATSKLPAYAQKPAASTPAAAPAPVTPTTPAAAPKAEPAPPAAEKKPAQQPTAAAAPSAGAPAAAVQILTGPNAGREMDLVKNLTTLGKPGLQVAVLTRRPHGYFITHVEGASFPVLNGKPLDEHPHQLNDHDIVELAGVKMEFYFKT